MQQLKHIIFQDLLNEPRKQGCQKFRAQVAANFTKSRGRQRKSSPIFPKLKCTQNALIWALYVSN